MTDRELMQQALKALERYQVKRQDFDRFADEITALRERLAQPEQEPVAWMYVNMDGECEQIEYLENEPMPDDPSITPLYTAPPPRQWQGLTYEEVGALTVFNGLHHVEVPVLADFIRAIEAKIKEKNGG